MSERQQSVYQKDPKGLRLSLHVQPGVAKSAFVGLHDGALKLRIQARAQEGAANKAVCEFLAAAFKLPKSSVNILSGHSSRRKTVMLYGDANGLLETLEKIISNLDPASGSMDAR